MATATQDKHKLKTVKTAREHCFISAHHKYYCLVVLSQCQTAAKGFVVEWGGGDLYYRVMRKQEKQLYHYCTERVSHNS